MSDPQPQLFGTDGMRGTFGQPPLDEFTVRRLGRALVAHLDHHRGRGQRQLVLGGDTRFSTPTLCSWLAAELCRGGVTVVDLGVVPTPAVAFTVRQLAATGGIAVSASHNPAPDNGIKLIDAHGLKWSPGEEVALEARMFSLPTPLTSAADPAGEERALDVAAVAAYRDFLRGSVGDCSFRGCKVALDLAHGAATPHAAQLFADLGADVVAAHAAPDGHNINDHCGSTHPQALLVEVQRSQSDLGFAFDGDADRVVFVDESGTLRDGDAILYLWASALAEQGQLPGRRIVATSMSNLGLEIALRQRGIALVRCNVGDREVMTTMMEQGILLGGEQSGHLIHRGLSTTGDGLLTALQLLALRQRTGRPLAEQLAGFTVFPQLIRNVRVHRKPPLEGLPQVQKVSAAVTTELGREGRLVLRYSGTEPLVRIMIEGRERAQIETLAETLAQTLSAELT